MYRSFERHCRTDTPPAKPARLWQQSWRHRSLGRSLDKLESPNLKNALVFSDDKLLPATSNVVERGNHRHRKIKKTAYGEFSDRRKPIEFGAKAFGVCDSDLQLCGVSSFSTPDEGRGEKRRRAQHLDESFFMSVLHCRAIFGTRIAKTLSS